MSESIVIPVLMSLPFLLLRALLAEKMGSFAFIDFVFSWKIFYTPLGIIRRWQHVATQDVQEYYYYQNQGDIYIYTHTK